MSQQEFDAIAREVGEAWSRAGTRDEGFRVIVEFGRKYGFKNVIAAIEGRTPKRFGREQPVSEWVEERRREESD